MSPVHTTFIRPSTIQLALDTTHIKPSDAACYKINLKGWNAAPFLSPSIFIFHIWFSLGYSQGGTIKHLNMWGTLVNSTMSSVALTVLRHGGCCTASISKYIRAAYYIHNSPSLLVGLTTAGWLNSAQKNGIPVCLQGFLKIACCQSLQLSPAPSELNKTRRAQQLPWDSGSFSVWATEQNKIHCPHSWALRTAAI